MILCTLVCSNLNATIDDRLTCPTVLRVKFHFPHVDDGDGDADGDNSDGDPLTVVTSYSIPAGTAVGAKSHPPTGEEHFPTLALGTAHSGYLCYSSSNIGYVLTGTCAGSGYSPLALCP